MCTYHAPLRKGWADGRVPILSTSDLSVNGLLDQPAGLEINKSSAEQGLEEGLAHQYYTAPIPGWTSYWLRAREILSVRRKHRAYLLYLCLHLKIKKKKKKVGEEQVRGRDEQTWHGNQIKRKWSQNRRSQTPWFHR
jgi:hypothetical protein